VAALEALGAHQEGNAVGQHVVVDGPIVVVEAEAAYRKALAIRETLVKDFSSVPSYRSELGECYRGLGLWLSAAGRLEEALKAYRQALALQEDLLRGSPNVAGHRAALVECLHSLGALLQKQGQQREAEAAFRRALSLCEDLVRDSPTSSLHQVNRALFRAYLGNHAEAVSQASHLARDKDTLPVILYTSACVYAVAAAAVKEDAKRANQYGGRALELLARARTAGYFTNVARVEELKEDSDLDALRARADFKKLLASLEAVPAARK
jgi:tetratricopeptide (TPR) repeat protein